MFDSDHPKSPNLKPRVIVAQIGARMHYAVPSAFQRLGLLHHFYTDLIASPASRAVLNRWPAAWRPPAVERFLGRDPGPIPIDKITCTPGFAAEFARRRRRAANDAELAEIFQWSGQTFCRQVLRRGFRERASSATALYTFAGGGLELLVQAKALGLCTMTEQYIAPFVEAELLAEEHARFPQWEATTDCVIPEEYHRERLTREWHVADVVICPSEFVKAAVVQAGVAESKCRIVPYAVDASQPVPPRDRRSGKLRVLTVGAVGLRKGAPYILEAATQLAEEAEFRLVGACHLTPQARKRMETKVDLIGPVPRSKIAEHFAWADVFLLPSLCEGSATTTYEAMASGLPVICTPHTGSVIQDGIQGKIVPIRDAKAIVAALRELGDPIHCRRMAAAAVARSREFTVDRYAERLHAELRRLPATEVFA